MLYTVVDDEVAVEVVTLGTLAVVCNKKYFQLVCLREISANDDSDDYFRTSKQEQLHGSGWTGCVVDCCNSSRNKD